MVFVKDLKTKQIVDILCRKLGHTDIVDVQTQPEFDEALSNYVDKTAGHALFGKSARPKVVVDLFIVDSDSPERGAAGLVKSVKGRFMGNSRWLIIGENKYFNDMAAALKDGATDMLVKPFSREDFNKKMENVLSDNPITVTPYSGPGHKTDIFSPIQVTKTSMTPSSSTPLVATPVIDSVGGGTDHSFYRTVVAETADNVAKEGAAGHGGTSQSFYRSVDSTSKVVPKLGQEVKSGGGTSHSFYRNTDAKKTAATGEVTATLIDGQINGHYHEKVQVVGGAENCYWAKETEDGKVRLEYITPKGKASGVEAKVISKEEFMYNYYLCAEYGCHILKRLGQWPPKEP